MKKINYSKFLKSNPEDIIHVDKKNYYVIRKYEKVEEKPLKSLFGNNSGGSSEKKKVYIVLRKLSDKSFEELFKDTSYERTKKMYNSLRTLNGDNFVVKYDDKKYIFKDIKTGYEFGEYDKTSELKKVIKDKYEQIYKFKNYGDIIDNIVKRAEEHKKLKTTKIKTNKSGGMGNIKLKGINIKIK